MTTVTEVDRPGSAVGPRAWDGDSDLLRELVAYATLAPSSHNTQPWLFRVDGDIVEVRADRRRALPVADPYDRELTISCGAAVGFLRVAMEAHGYEPVVERLPDPADPDLLARVGLGPPCPATPEAVELFAAIAKRRTNRLPFDPRCPPDSALAGMEALAAGEGAWLRPVHEPGQKRAIAEFIAEGDRRQACDPAFRRELASWIHPNGSAARDGMKGTSFGVSDAESHVLPTILRTLNWGRRQAEADRALAEAGPVLAVLGTGSDNTEAWLRAGEALAMVLLRATADGLSASFLNQAVQVPALRCKLARLLGVSAAPQVVLRLGFGSAAPVSARRPLSEVLLP